MSTHATESSQDRALVVDDSKAMRMILSRILSGLGFEVHQAANGIEGLVRLGEVDEVRLALVDWNMPEMNGIEFVKAVRESGRFEGLRMMMVTSESDASRMVDALDAGADEYAMKPFDAEIIREKLELIGLGSR
ncbi:MAG: response regulator [Acidimicrobiales bacterium]